MSGPVLLLGAGAMAVAYAEVLLAQGVESEVLGRSEAGCERFTGRTGLRAEPGGLDALRDRATVPDLAVVAVSHEALAPAVTLLLERGVRRVLLEKPGAANPEEAAALAGLAAARGVDVRVAYNRRYYAATTRAVEIIEDDGGVRSMSFDFTEWPDRVLATDRSPAVLAEWFAMNSSHVVDLAFYLGGEPVELSTYVAGRLDWHPSAARFSGAGRTATGALFSYGSDWDGPGRWGIEVVTERHRLVLRPMEELRVQPTGSLVAEVVDLGSDLDQRFKPGLFAQVADFLAGGPGRLPTIAEQAVRWRDVFHRMAGIGGGAPA